MKFFNWINVRLILMCALVIFLFAFTSIRNSQRKIVKTEVIFVENDADFISEKTVNKLLIENNADASAIRKDKLDLNKLEKAVSSNQMVEESEVFVTIDGVLKAVVKQKTPIVRVFDGKRSFYIDYKGNTMPLSANFTARVPLVLGVIRKQNSEALAELFRKIYDDEFLKKNIIAIQIMPNGSLKMLNRNFDYQIDFGGAKNVDAKFQNYKAFFQKAVVDSSLYKYKKIDLRFTQQVICTK